MYSSQQSTHQEFTENDLERFKNYSELLTKPNSAGMFIAFVKMTNF